MCRQLKSIMHRWVIVLGIVACACPGSLPGQSSALADNKPQFPRFGMLWAPADGPGEKLDKWARYGVIVTGISGLGLAWEQHQFAALAESVRPDTIAQGRNTLTDLRRRNPNSLVLYEIYYFEADVNTYPEDSPWWFRDAKGETVEFWKGCRNMAVDNPGYIEHIVRRIEAVYKALEGKAGVYLDNLRFDKTAKNGWANLLQLIRRRCPGIVIMVNAGWDSDDLDWIAPQVNGIMYEDSVAHTADGDTEAFYGRIHRLGQLCREPRISINEKFGKRQDEPAMMKELVRTLVYTDLFYIYTDGTNGHRHNWWPQWDAQLGRAAGVPVGPEPGRLARREFEGGTVFWLPATAKKPVTVALEKSMQSLADKKDLSEVHLEPGTGVLLIHKGANR